ncbi:hypothetical protein [Actinomadura sp. KC216]|nr:hypothetical protein [Actinomadura sp. KC216]
MDGMALLIVVPAFFARRLVISLTCLLARRHTAALAGWVCTSRSLRYRP